jgi:hypothetical protein
MSNSPKSLAAAMRERATWLNDSQRTNSHLEYGWVDKNSVIAALMEVADVIDSWSGEYLSKEETHEENQRRRWGTQHWTIDPQPPMTMEERIAIAKNRTTFNYGEENNGND